MLTDPVLSAFWIVALRALAERFPAAPHPALDELIVAWRAAGRPSA